MRIAITGATGNVGTALLRRLADESEVEVVGFARRTPGPEAGPPYEGVRWHSVDIGDPACVDPLAGWFAGADAVVHLAWQVQPSHRRAQLRHTNLTGTTHVHEAIRRAGIRSLVYASSVGAYAPGPKDRYVDEDWPVTGVRRSGYSIDKAVIEAALDDIERDDPALRVVRMRPALTFQRDAGAEITRYFLGPLARPTLRRASPIIPVNKRLRIQAVHADDLAEAYLRVLRSDVRGAFNIAAEPVLDGASVAAETGGLTVPMTPRVLRLLAKAAWRLHLQPTEPGWFDLLTCVPLMDCSRAERELGWRARHDARLALHDLLDGITVGAGTAGPALRPTDGSGWRTRAGARSRAHRPT